MDLTSGRKSGAARWPALAAGVVWSWAATNLRPFTAPALAATLLTGFLVVAAGTRARSRQPIHHPAGGPIGVHLWLALLAGLCLWELLALVQLPRPDHPTLSSLANEVFDSHLVRAAAFAAWIAAGFGLVRR